MLAVAEFDFGDAPAPYATTLADDGPRHELIGPTLGMSADAEADGQPSSAADGDGSDEDGVTFGSIRVGQLDASVTVNVQNAPTGARLDAWIDFNGDGSWGGAFERIANRVAVTEGNNVLRFDIPSWAASGETFARFRLSTTAGLAPRGSAVDGEVEDYMVTIQPLAANDGNFGQRNLISSEPPHRARWVFAAVLRSSGMKMLAARVISAHVKYFPPGRKRTFPCSPPTWTRTETWTSSPEHRMTALFSGTKT